VTVAVLWALLGACGCGAAVRDPGARIDREHELTDRFSRQHFCPRDQVSVAGRGTTFDVSGCGKTARFDCPTVDKDARHGGHHCSERAGQSRGVDEPRRNRQSTPEPNRHVPTR
jgi:hypothetical protein